VSIRIGVAGELVTGLNRDADAGIAAGLHQMLKAAIAGLARYAYPIQRAVPGSNRLLHRVETIKNVHTAILPAWSYLARQSASPAEGVNHPNIP